MGLDMAKYRRIFLEEGVDHLAELSRALLDLEKEMGNGDAIDTIFRMAHSIKSMAASLGYDAIAELSHRLEDRMEGLRADGRVRDHAELSLLFRALESLEAMFDAVGREADPGPVPPDLLADLSAPAPSAAAPASDAAGAEAPEGPAPAAPAAIGGEPKKARS